MSAVDLRSLELSGMTRLGARLRTVAAEADSLEEVASATARLLFDATKDPTTGEPSCGLVRCYVTLPFGALGPDLQTFGQGLMVDEELRPETACLTLLGTAGELPEWNDRHRSVGHRTIPLPSEAVVQKIPMVAHALAQFGLEVSMVVAPDPVLVLEREQHTYNVFFVEKAEGSPYIPAQADFVLPHGIRSVLGYGGLLPSGAVYSVLMFSKVDIPRHVADLFRNAAMNTKLALLPFADGPYFAE